MPEDEDKSPKLYYLVSGEVEYVPNGEKEPQHRRVNAIQTLDGDELDTRTLGKFQIALQQHFHMKYSRTHPKAPEITDVVIFGISYLGEFTKAQFLAKNPQ